MRLIFGAALFAQTILHYLGLLGIFLGILAFLFGNTSRGTELLIGGFSFIVLKYITGFLFHLFTAIFGEREE